MSDARPRRRREGAGPEVVVIYWRDIPAQVNAQRDRDRHQVLLPAQFQRAIDRAKRKAKIYTAQEDVAQWRRESRPCGDDLAEEADRRGGAPRRGVPHGAPRHDRLRRRPGPTPDSRCRDATRHAAWCSRRRG